MADAEIEATPFTLWRRHGPERWGKLLLDEKVVHGV